MIEVKNISYAYRPGTDVLRGVSFALEQGECLAVLGNNGAGKSTLLKCVDAICPTADGAVLVDGTDIFRLSGRERAKRLAYVPQRTEPGGMTVFDSVLLGRRPYIKWDASDEDRQIAEDALCRLGLEGLALRKMGELSGGEAQKVTIARALAQAPGLLLLDEPTSNLDLHNQHEVLRTIRSIAREQKLSVIIIIHDLNLAIRYCDKFLFLKDAGVFAAGGRGVFTPETIEKTYGVHVHITDCKGIPVVVPFPDEPV